ncbi:MAG TPA: ThuA domain-containing protein [Candidatus Binatia bacterium]|jgi:glucose/arabinose dehydrogenase|nr:ThuA domain-containing protein [Candidatus Binatia bacterium]
MRSLLAALVATAFSGLPADAAPARDVGCANGQFVVTGGPLLPGGGTEPDVITIDGRSVTIPGACGRAIARVKRRPDGFRVRAHWRRCDDRGRLVRLIATVDAGTCRTMTGRLRTAAGDTTFAADRAVRALVFSRTAGFRHPSIDDAKRVLGALRPSDGIVTTLTEDPTRFTDDVLDGFDVVLFASTTGDVLDEAQQAAMERFIQRGGGYVGVHSAADTEYQWPWYGRLVGAYFTSHPLLPVTVTVTTEDDTHPSTAHLPPTFAWTDEIYNLDRNPRVDNVILLTVDESGFIYPNFPGGPSMGADHPVAWYKEFDGGRSFYTNLGHRPESWDDPRFRQHLLAGIRWAAGPVAWSRVVLTGDARNPLALSVAPDGGVYYIERTGEVKLWSPTTGRVSLAARLDVDTTAENGLLGIALDPAFAANRRVWLYHSTPVADPPPVGRPPGDNVLSRFTARADGTLDMASRTDVLVVPSERECCHEGGSLAFGPDGTLFLSVGDNTDPFGDSEGSAPLDERPGRERWNSQRTAQNPFDLRGKILRIDPDGSIPSGNLFPPDGSEGRPEIYTMGSRNPYRTAIDPRSGRLYWGEVGPDAFEDSRRGPRGFDEINVADSPGNYGWPYCIGFDVPYADYDYATGSVSGAFTCATYRPAVLAYDYLTPSYLALGTAFPSEGASFTGRTAIAGTFYHAPAGVQYALPPPYADTLLMTDWTRDILASVDVAPDGTLAHLRRLLPWETFLRPIDLDVGPDGALYVMEYGTGFYGDNLDARLSRIEHSAVGRLKPIAAVTASATAGQAPLSVTFSAEGSRTPGQGDRIARYEWDIDGDGRPDSRAATLTHTFGRNGVYPVSLVVVADSGERSFPGVAEIVVGNTPPEVTIISPADEATVRPGSIVTLRGSGVDAEDGTAPCDALTWDVRLGHNAHTHPLATRFGCDPTFRVVVPDGHATFGNLFIAIELTWTDGGGPNGEPPLVGRQGIRVNVGPQGSPSGAFLEP